MGLFTWITGNRQKEPDGASKSTESPLVETKADNQTDALVRQGIALIVDDCRNKGSVLGMHVVNRIQRELPEATATQIVEVLKTKDYDMKPISARVAEINALNRGGMTDVLIGTQHYRFTKQPPTPEQEQLKYDPDATGAMRRHPMAKD